MKIYDGGVIRDMTAEEEAAMIEAAARHEVEERLEALEAAMLELVMGGTE